MAVATRSTSALCLSTLAMTLLAPLPLMADRAHLTPSEMKQIIQEAEENADDFDGDFDDGMDKTGLDGSDEEERLDHQAEALEEKLDKIRDEFERGEDRVEIRPLVDRAIAIAADIDRVMTRYRFNQDFEGDWRLIRKHLNSMAHYYGLRPLAGRAF